MAQKAASSSPRPLNSAAPLAVGSPAAASSLLALAPTSSSSILIYLAALVSAGILIRTLHPRFRYRLAHSSSKGGKRRETVIKKIIAQQEATQADSPADRSVKPTSSGATVRSRSGTLTAGRERSLSSACVATTSAAIASGLGRISTVATGAIASTSSAKLDSPTAIGTAGAKPGSAGPQRDGKGAPISSGGGNEDAFSSSVGRLLSVEQGGKKGKGKKGKGIASSSHNSSLAATPSASPARRPFTRSSSVEPESLPTFEVSTQTAFAPPRIERTTTSTSTPTPTASHPHFDLPLSDSNLNSHPPSSTPPKPPPIPSTDATVQTSPRLAGRSTPPPAIPRPFDLHASFQSTPPLRPSPQPSAAYPVPSPPPSPSPSRRPSPLPPTDSPRIFNNRTIPPPTDLLSTSPSPATSRSRKQARKASAAAAAAAAANGVTAQQPIVVGMPRPPRSRDPTDEIEMDGGDGGGCPKLLRVDTSPSRLSQSPEKSTIGLPSMDKGKGKGSEREREQSIESRAINGTAMGSGKGRYGIPAPIPIPSDQRRLSTSTTDTNSGGSSSTSPYLSHRILMTMTPPDAGRRTSVTSAKGSSRHEEAFWRGEEGAGEKWDPGMMGLAIELNESERRRSREEESVDSRRAGSVEGSRGNETTRSWSSTGGSSSPNVPSISDGYFPPGAHTAMTSPDSSPHPPSRQLLPLSSTSNQRPWSPQLMAQQYTMIPYPVSGNGSSSTPQQPPPLPHTHSSGGGQTPQTRSSSRQTSLSVPLNTAQQQQAAHLQQQQAYAFYAHAQAQYQHVIALQLQAQQHHQRQVAQHQQQQQQQHQQRQRHDSEHSNHSLSNANGQAKPPPTPNGLVYPISGTHIPPPQTPQSLAQAQVQAQAQGWTTLPGSPGFPPPSGANGQYGIGSSVSPTSATFPSSASSTSYSHIHQLPQVQQTHSNAYYLGSPTAAYLSNYTMSPQMPQLGQRQPSSSKRGNGGGRNAGGDGDKLRSPRPGGDRVRSASAAAITTMSSPSLGGPPPSDMVGWKSKARVAEMDADRSAKELEIARWRLAVLEEEQRTIELENQEALRALATRAMRAEARIKLLEEARAHDSSSASGSGSPATRPSSIAGSNEMPAEMLPPPISFDENDSSTRDSPPGVKVHPLAWLDLDTVSFNVRPPSNVRPAFNSIPSSRRKGGRASSDFKSNRRTNTRRRSSNGGNTSFGTPIAPPVEDEEEEEVLILLDSPLRRKSIPHNPVSRRSSFLGDDFAFEHHETSSNLDEDEISNLDFDEAESRSARGEPTGTSEYIGFLPTFLKPGSTSRPPSVAGSASPHFGPQSVVEDRDGEEAAAGEEEGELEGEMSDTVDGGDNSEAGLQIRVNGFSPTIDPDVSLPSFILDTAIPDFGEEERTAMISPLNRPPLTARSPPSMSIALSDYSSTTLSAHSSEERTPKVAPPPSPPVVEEGKEDELETPGADVKSVVRNGEEEQAAEELAPENKER